MGNNKFNINIFKSLKGFPSLKILNLVANDFQGPLHIQGASHIKEQLLHMICTFNSEIPFNLVYRYKCFEQFGGFRFE